MTKIRRTKIWELGKDVDHGTKAAVVESRRVHLSRHQRP